MRLRIAAALMAIIAVLGFAAVPAYADDSSQTYQITDTGIGIMFRSDPNNWDSRTGPAGYDGDNATLTCEAEGTPVGNDVHNHMWYQATTAHGSGWLPDHFLNTPVKANEWLPGMPPCDGINNDGSGPAIQAASPIRSVFFSGTNNPQGVANGSVADSDYSTDDYGTNGTCDGSKIPAMVPSTVDTLAGWSRGRIGVVYFLAYAPAERVAAIHKIVLFDPGATSDIAGRVIGPFHNGGGCDYRYDVNNLLANWLSSDDRNQLIIIGAVKSEMKKAANDPSSKSTYAGLWKYYFADIWNQPFANQAQVCDYNMLSHDDAIRDFSGIVKESWNGCPAAPAGHPLQAWNP